MQLDAREDEIFFLRLYELAGDFSEGFLSTFFMSCAGDLNVFVPHLSIISSQRMVW